MTSTEANQFLTENGRNLASIGIVATVVDGTGDTHIQLEHAASAAMPVLLGDLPAVMNFMLGLQMGIAVAAVNQGEIEERLESLTAKVTETRHAIDAATERRQAQVGGVELEEDM
jgi:hypothetical protein